MKNLTGVGLFLFEWYPGRLP